MNKYLIVFEDSKTGKLKNVTANRSKGCEVDNFIKSHKHNSDKKGVRTVYDLTNKKYIFKARSKDMKANVPNSITQPPTVYNDTVGLAHR